MNSSNVNTQILHTVALLSAFHDDAETQISHLCLLEVYSIERNINLKLQTYNLRTNFNVQKSQQDVGLMPQIFHFSWQRFGSETETLKDLAAATETSIQQ